MVLKYFVVAEAGVNHEGDWSNIKEMITLAAEAGADAIKFQSYSANDIIKAERMRSNSQYTERHFKAIKKAELNYREFKAIKQLCDEANIEFMVTPFISPTRVDKLSALVRRWKIRERDSTNDALIIEALRHGNKDVLISTTRYHFEWYNPQVKQIFCIPKYPATPLDVAACGYDISRMGVFDGYSNHIKDLDVVALICAAQLLVGHKPWFYVELHYKLEGTSPIDDAVSFTAPEISGLVKVLRKYERLESEGITPRREKQFLVA